MKFFERFLIYANADMLLLLQLYYPFTKNALIMYLF